MIHLPSTIREQVTPTDLLLLQNFEQELQAFAKQQLNKEEFRHLRLLFHLEVGEKRPEAPVHIIDNADFTLMGSYGLSQQLKHYVEKRDDLELALRNVTLVIKLTFSEKPVDKKSESTPAPSQSSADALPDFYPIKPRYSFAQMVLPSDLHEEIISALRVIECQDLIYNQWGFSEVDPVPRSILNFHGAPGTGKTMCAHAIADYLHKPLLSLNYAEIESKYVGEAPKNLQKAFDVAREQDCVLFFDEADSFLGRRIQNVQQGADQALNSLRSQMLILLEEHQGVVIFATNLVTNFDPAFESRILKHLHFELPNREARAAILRKMLPSRLPLDRPFTDEDLLHISAEAEGLSGRELKNAVLSMLVRHASPDTVFTPGMLLNAIIDCVHQKELLRQEEQRQADEKERRRKEAITNRLKEKLAGTA